MIDFLPGIDVLLNEYPGLLSGQRVGLVAHPASVDSKGVHSAIRLQSNCELAALFGPEHGYAGMAAAGLKVSDGVHKEWGIPVFSLYGETRKPTGPMMNGLDVLVFDLQSLAVRCYTYASSLRYLLEAGAEHGVKIIVTDRPVPMRGVVDGPGLDEECESFVGMVNTPFCFGLTMGELARVVVEEYKIDVEWQVIPFRGDPGWRQGASWIPPSPGIRTYMTALTYPATVCCEALPILDYGRGRSQIFQVIAAPWLHGHNLARTLSEYNLPGVIFHPVQYRAEEGLHQGKDVQGIRLEVVDEMVWRPCAAMVYIMSSLQKMYGADKLWNSEDARPKFFDKLMGTARIRTLLQKGVAPDEIISHFGEGGMEQRHDRSERNA